MTTQQNHPQLVPLSTTTQTTHASRVRKLVPPFKGPLKPIKRDTFNRFARVVPPRAISAIARVLVDAGAFASIVVNGNLNSVLSRPVCYRVRFRKRTRALDSMTTLEAMADWATTIDPATQTPVPLADFLPAPPHTTDTIYAAYLARRDNTSTDDATFYETPCEYVWVASTHATHHNAARHVDAAAIQVVGGTDKCRRLKTPAGGSITVLKEDDPECPFRECMRAASANEYLEFLYNVVNRRVVTLVRAPKSDVPHGI